MENYEQAIESFDCCGNSSADLAKRKRGRRSNVRTVVRERQGQDALMLRGQRFHECRNRRSADLDESAPGQAIFHYGDEGGNRVGRVGTEGAKREHGVHPRPSLVG